MNKLTTLARSGAFTAVLAALLPLGFAAAAADDVSNLRDQANKAFHAKNYADACPLFAKVRELTPNDAGGWADLGLCLGKLGKRDDALAADRKAVELGDERTRLNAYFNLGSLKAALGAPQIAFDAKTEPAPGKVACASLGATATCAKELFACLHTVDLRTSGAVDIHASLVFGADRAALEARLAELDDLPAGLALELARYAHPHCLHGDFPVCTEDHCGKHPTKECYAKESKACDAQMEQCDSAPGEVENQSCVVVHADACLGRVGVVCANKARELNAARAVP